MQQKTCRVDWPSPGSSTQDNIIEISEETMSIIVLKTAVDQNRYLLWSTTYDAPIKYFSNRWELRQWYLGENYSRYQLQVTLKQITDTGTDGEYGGFDTEHIPVGEPLCPPDGWWRISRSKLDDLFERVASGASCVDLLERYAD